MPEKIRFRKGTKNLVFSGRRELLDEFKEGYQGQGKLVNIVGRHPYEDVLDLADPLAEGMLIYLLETADEPAGRRFTKQPQVVFDEIINSYDTVLQIIQGKTDVVNESVLVSAYKVNGTMLHHS